MKEFDLVAAKNGAKVCTRDGRHARIICFDCLNDDYPIIALVLNDGIEEPCSYAENGFFVKNKRGQPSDLMMVGSFSATEEYRGYQFEPFERVLVRNFLDEIWRCNIFSHKEDGRFATTEQYTWEYCIPYNETTKQLVGTTNDEI